MSQEYLSFIALTLNQLGIIYLVQQLATYRSIFPFFSLNRRKVKRSVCFTTVVAQSPDGV